MSDPIEILDYWLGEVGPEGWYGGGEALDSDIRARFGDIWQAAAEGGLEHWVEGTVGTLAYLILCDQMARNMHRGSAQSSVLTSTLNAPEPERQFFYMPFEHSEHPADQDRAVELLTERLASDPEMALHARAHREIIAEFGRFPFRNAALNRENTTAEAEFLAAGGYAALVNRLKASHATDA